MSRSFSGNTIRFKVMLGVLVPVATILGLFTLVTYDAHRDVMLATTTRTVSEVGRLVEGGLTHAMLTSDRPAMRATIDQLVHSTGIEGLMLLNSTSEVRFAADHSKVGRTLDPAAAGCGECHQPGLAEPTLQTAAVTVPGVGRVLRNCRPIENRSECHDCHEADQRFNGVLITDVSLVEVDEALAHYAHFALLVLFGALVAGGGVVWVAMDRLVVSPIEGLTASARRIARGEPVTPVPVHSDDELGELARVLDMAAGAMADRAGLLKATIQAQEAERKRVARQLHDDLAQSLTALIMSLDATAPQLDPQAADLRSSLARTRALLAQALEQTRHLILDLRPTMLDDLGLVSAIRWYAETHLTGGRAEVTFASAGPARRLRSELETALFRIAQEALNNVARHADAHRVSIVLDWQAEQVVLRVTDDGRGFDIAATGLNLESGAGLGLLGMRERTAMAGGQLVLDSQPGHGTRVEARVPTRPGDEIP